MTNLAERLRLLNEKSVAALGPVERLLSGLDPETAEILESLLIGNASIRSIFNELKDEKYSISRESLARYRKQQRKLLEINGNGESA